MTDDGKLSVGERLKQIEDQQRASDDNCRHSNTKIWSRFASLELAWETKMNEVKVELARSQTKLTIAVSIACFIASTVAAVIIKVFLK